MARDQFAELTPAFGEFPQQARDLIERAHAAVHVRFDEPPRHVVVERLEVFGEPAAGLGIDAMLLDPTCTDPLYRRVARVAMGEGYAFPWAWLPRLPGGLDVVRSAGFRLLALTPAPGATPLDRLAVSEDERIALLFGAEGSGLSATALDAADERIGIPMHGGVDSLNVGVAAGIACWALARHSA